MKWHSARKGLVVAGALCAVLATGYGEQIVSAAKALAAGIFTNGVCTAGSSGTSTGSPAVTYCNNSNTYPLSGIEQIPADTELSGGQSPQSEAITVAQLGAYVGGLPSRGNALIGGDASTNLFQRGTSGASVTTTATFGGPDRWFYWSGTNTAMTVSQDTTAADLATGYQAAFKMARTSGQTGVVQVCMAQEVESVNSFQFQGSTAELDFHVRAGANFSAASSQMQAYIIYGTSTDEGASKLAFGLNAGGGGASAWTGQANAASPLITVSTTNTRYAVVASIPSTAKEIAVALCWTPVGTAGTNDYLAISGIQLVRNTANSGAASASVGYQCAAGGIQCLAFDRRSQALESVLQYRYYYQITESSTALNIRGTCIMSTTSIANCLINFPVTMRVAPTMSYATGFEASATTASTSATACTGVTTSATLTGNAASTNAVLIDCASSAGFGAAGTGGFIWDVGTGSPTGAIKANAEMT